MKISVKTKTFFISLIAILALTIAIWADTSSTTVTFVIPTSLSHSVSYGGACSSSDFYFVESDATKDGTQNTINVTSSNDGTGMCQNSTVSGMLLTNTGNSNIHIYGNFSSELPSGILVKATSGPGGWQSVCSGVVGDATCANMTHSASVQLEANLAAAGTENIWLYCDMDNFNSGASTSGVTRTFQTNGIGGT